MASFPKKNKSTKKVDKITEEILPPIKQSNRDRLAAQGFKKGQVANPLGRPKGSRNKLSEKFVGALLHDFEEFGDVAIAKCRIEDPSRYCAIVAALIPKDFEQDEKESNIEKILEQFNTVEELQQFLEGIRLIGAAQRGEQKAIAPSNGGKSNRVH